MSFVQVDITTTKEDEESYRMKQVMIKHGAPLIRDQLGAYIKELKEGTTRLF